MKWQDTKSKLQAAAQYIKKHKILDAGMKTLIGKIPVVGDFIVQYWNNLDLSENEKAVQVGDFLERLSAQEEKHFKFLIVYLEEQKQELITGKQSLDKLLDEVAVLHRVTERILETATATQENTEDLKKIAFMNRRMLVKILEQLGIHSTLDAVESRGSLSEGDLRNTEKIERIDKAIRETGITLDPTYSYQMGLMAAFQRRYLDSENYFKKALAADPRYGDAQTGLGHLYQIQANDMLGRRDFASAEQLLKQAELHIRKALSLDATDLKALVQLGYIFKELGQSYVLMRKPEKASEPLDKAKRHFELVLGYDNQNADAYNGLGNVCFLQNDLDSAITHHKKALQIAPDYIFARHDLAWVYKRKGDEDISSRGDLYEKAIKEFKKVLQLNERQLSLNPASLNQIRSAIDTLQNYLNQN